MVHAEDIQELEEEHVMAAEIDELAYEDLISIIQQLPAGYKIVFNMYAIEGYSHKEIAEEMGISESTSKSQLLRAREWLKKRIKLLEGGVYEKKHG